MDRKLRTSVFAGCFILMIVTALPCHASFVIRQKNGSEMIWETYRTEGDFYCTTTTVGRQCIPKKDVASISEIKADSSAITPPDQRSAFGHGFSVATLVRRCEELVSEKYDNLEFVTNGGQVKETGGKVWIHVRRYLQSDNSSQTRISYFTTCTLERSSGRWAIQLKMIKM